MAWPVSHTRPDTANDKRDIEFTVKAQVLKVKEIASEAEADAEESKVADEKTKSSDAAKDEL